MKNISKMPISHTSSTPLHLAAYGGHYSVAESLLSAGAPLLDKNRFGDTFFHIAIRHGREQFMKDILKYIEDKIDQYFPSKEVKKKTAIFDIEND